MKGLITIGMLFVLTFALVVGAVVFIPSQAEARPPILPCDFPNEDIYCTGVTCQGTYGPGGYFFCESDPSTWYCSTDYKGPIPCIQL